jgi:hypothetical protein
MSDIKCATCEKLEEVLAIGIQAPTWVCYDCGRPIVAKEGEGDI